ncbi:hypothetical protein INT47_012931 [Mucor saturninus]|uniref:Uncharacterized protein n=1 Tax=Mucor saturninus TaxID=64648 RepID=A0A8H7UU54_9FUNG|nr:hypothetical protein INT47_012931 [Mucor saturninus]
MFTKREIDWIVHFQNSGLQARQYVFRLDSEDPFSQLMDEVEKKTGAKVQEVTYVRSKESPNVIIDDDESMHNAIEYMGDRAYTKGIPVNVFFSNQ